MSLADKLRPLSPMIVWCLYYVLWMLPAGAQVCLAVWMWRRGMQLRVPVFFGYTVFQVAAFCVQFGVYHFGTPKAYFYAYWVAAAISIGLGLGVIYEVFREVFRPFIVLADFGNMLFRWAGLVLVLAAALMAMSSTANGQHPAMALVLNLERSTRVMQCGLVLLLVLCSAHLGLSFRSHIFGIALGFGVIAAVDLVAVAALTSIGNSALTFFRLAKLVAYFGAVAVWTGYLVRREPERAPAAEALRGERWDFALASALDADGVGPALPMIQSAVERVFEKTNGKNGTKDNGKPQTDQ